MHLPIDTHGDGDGKEKIVTTNDVLDDLSEVDMKCAYVPVVAKDGKISYCDLDHSEDGTFPLRKDFQKLNSNMPSHTVIRKDNIVHYKFNRHVTVREAARLQSFPDNFKFFGTRRDKLNGIGNAVPVHLATAIARCVFQMHEDIAKFR